MSFERGFSQEVDKSLEWANNLAHIWKDIYDSKEVVVPTDPKEAASYIEKITYLKEHNQEKFHDAEGIEFYKRLDTYVEKLKEVK